MHERNIRFVNRDKAESLQSCTSLPRGRLWAKRPHAALDKRARDPAGVKAFRSSSGFPLFVLQTPPCFGGNPVAPRTLDVMPGGSEPKTSTSGPNEGRAGFACRKEWCGNRVTLTLQAVHIFNSPIP